MSSRDDATSSLIRRRKSKYWVFTLNNPDISLAPLHDPENITYCVYQLERGASGTEHYQGYIQFKKRTYFPTVVSYLPGAHVEIARGTPKQARDYCMKADTRVSEPVEFGEFQEITQGKRNDLEDAKIILDQNVDESEFASQCFSVFAKYPSLFERYQTAKVVPRTSKCNFECILHIGRPRLGKSSFCDHRYPGAFRKQPGKWWNGYRGESTVIFDDFRGSFISFTDFKLIADRYPLRVEIKGSYCNLAAYRFIFTTNQDPRDWYDKSVIGNDEEAVTARFTKIVHWVEKGQFREYDSFASYLASNTPTKITAHGTETIHSFTLPPIQVFDIPRVEVAQAQEEIL